MKSELKHISFIMDGNGRWAKKRLLPRTVGHKEGIKTMLAVCDKAACKKIPFVSFFAFSTENWSRPQNEVDSLLKLLSDNLPKVADEAAKKMYSVKVIGDITAFPQELQKVINRAELLTRGGKKLNIAVALNYGGKADIVQAANRAVRSGKTVSEDEFSGLLYTDGFPDPDLLVRTGGEMRLSNFMLYQSAYTELYFTDRLWPDFSDADFDAAVEEFNHRSRRFGSV